MKLNVLLLLGLLFNVSSQAERMHIAVASNFMPTLQILAKAFEQQTAHQIVISAGSTGQLYAQIKQGAPFDVYMAADSQRPQLLVNENLASQFQIYATGQLTLLSNLEKQGQCQAILNSSDLKHLAIAHPELAPYGLAAKEFLQKQSLWQPLQNKLVMGENITQTMQMVATKNATAGLISKSMLVNYTLKANQCLWEVPLTYYAPINQAMVLLNKSKQQKPYKALKQFLKTDEAITIMRDNGYIVETVQ